MISVAIWISSDDARIFTFKADGVETHHMHSHGPKHTSETHGRNHPKDAGDAEHFFHQVAEYMASHAKGARWLILGPGLAKTHFKSHIERHHAAHAKSVVGVEAFDKGTDGEIKNFAHDFFKKLGTFDAL